MRDLQMAIIKTNPNSHRRISLQLAFCQYVTAIEELMASHRASLA